MPDRIRARLADAAREHGTLAVARACAAWGARYAAGRVRDGGGTFAWGGERIPLFHHRYHYTWMNERGVELALAQRELAAARGSVLEVGNVLAHYLDTSHPVVDLYERAPGVVNEDVVHYDPGRRFDLIVSLSTIEHVGFDEVVLDPEKPERAIRALAGLLEPRRAAVGDAARGLQRVAGRADPRWPGALRQHPRAAPRPTADGPRWR